MRPYLVDMMARIDQRRRELGIRSLSELARRAGMRRDSIREIGRDKDIASSRLAQIAQALGCSMDWLAGISAVVDPAEPAPHQINAARLGAVADLLASLAAAGAPLPPKRLAEVAVTLYCAGTGEVTGKEVADALAQHIAAEPQSAHRQGRHRRLPELA